MKPKKKIDIKIVILIIVVLVIILIPVILLLSLIKDKSDSKDVMEIIRTDYTVFSDEVVEFNNYRDKVYDEIFADTYYESFKEKYEEFNNTFKDYEKTVDKIVKDSKKLIKYCDGLYYTDRDVNTMCSTFSENYEALYNSFIIDVKNYNTLIKEYNAFLKENNIEEAELSKYTTDKKYIDYNHDKKYGGKE